VRGGGEGVRHGQGRRVVVHQHHVQPPRPVRAEFQVCSMSALRDGPVTNMTLRGMCPPVSASRFSARSRSHASS
jgi:hypothetical protein